MSGLNQLVDEGTIEWLLEKENPSVRLFTLENLLGKTALHPEVLETRKDVMFRGIVPAILGRQDESGYWCEAERFYLEKYEGTVWQLLILAELGCAPEDERIRRACTFILENSQDLESYGFAVHRSGKNGGGRHSEVIPCLTGNMTWSLIRLGFMHDDRVQQALDWICRYQRSDDGGTTPPRTWPYERLEACWGRHSCHMGVVKALKALAAIPPDERSGAVRNKISELAEYLLVHRIFKRSHAPEAISKPGWLRFGFPLMYQTDVLEITSILTGLGYRDSRMDEALALIRSKQGADKRWKMENTFNGKMIVDIEIKGAPSKWITAKALRVLLMDQEPVKLQRA